MYKYRHTKTGRIVTTTCPVKGNQWKEVTEKQTPAKPAKPAEKGKK